MESREGSHAEVPHPRGVRDLKRLRRAHAEQLAASLARKRHAPEGPGSLHIETPTFALTTIAVIAILTLLQFMPALVLGPVAEHLSLVAH